MNLVKTLLARTCIAFCALGICVPVQTYSQCSGGLKSISYNISIAGTGNDYHPITIPQFDPSKGTLVAVKISSVISLQYAFQLENNSHAAASFTVGVGRNDYIGSTALAGPLTNMGNILQNVGPYSLAATDGVVGSGPDYIAVPLYAVLSNYNDISDSITGSVANFLGTGNVSFDYYSTTYYNVTGNYTFNYSASDVINFSVSYYYCNTAVLASTLIDFDAKLEKNNTIALLWQTSNEHASRTYGVQKSPDGINFSDLGNVGSLGDTLLADYSYPYELGKSDKDEIYFRLKIVDENKNIQYSNVRSVDLGELRSDLSLYPNPSNSFINVVLNSPVDNWQLDVLTPDGALLQRNNCANTNTFCIHFINKLAPGVYFVRAFDKTLNKSYVLSFMTQ